MKLADAIKNRFVKNENLRKKFLKLIPEDIDLLEIGPFYKPIFQGSKVKFFDILNTEELKKRAYAIGKGDFALNVPFIDYVSPNGDLGIIDRKFDGVVSSHVIEHQLDLIGHLQSVQSILNKSGSYYAIIPDKRYCFDHFHSPSTIADVVSAHIEKRTKHSLKSVIEHVALTTHPDAARHWKGDHGILTDTINRIEHAISEYQTGEYIDVHAWYFTPESFVNIIEVLKDLKYLSMTVDEVYSTGRDQLEFYVKLNKA